MLQTILSYVGIFALCGVMLYVAEKRKLKKYSRKVFGTDDFREGLKKYRESQAAAQEEAKARPETEAIQNDNKEIQE